MRQLSLILAILAAYPLSAQQPASQSRAALEQLQSELAERADKQRRLAEEAQEEGRQAEALSRKLVALGAEVQAAEQTLDRLDANIAELARRELVKTGELRDQRERLAKTLGALQRLSQTPPELALIQPDQAIDVVRGGGLLAGLMPEIRARAEDVRDAIDELAGLRNNLGRDREQRVLTLQQMESRRKDMARLRDQRKKSQAQLANAANREGLLIARLAAQAESLEELLAKLDRQRSLFGDAAKSSEAARPPGWDSGAPPIAEAKGLLAAPVLGSLIRRFGEEIGAAHARGLTIGTRPGAQVIAPYDGRVVYAGKFRAYGQILIIDHGAGYHSLLAGLDLLDGDVGQWVLAGEPIGRMAGSDQGQAAAQAAGRQQDGEVVGQAERNRLYLELRKNGKPINPLPWLATGTRKVG